MFCLGEKNEKEKKKLFAFWQQIHVFAEFWFQIWWLGHYSWFAWNSDLLTSEVDGPRRAGKQVWALLASSPVSLVSTPKSSSRARKLWSSAQWWAPVRVTQKTKTTWNKEDFYEREKQNTKGPLCLLFRIRYEIVKHTMLKQHRGPSVGQVSV